MNDEKTPGRGGTESVLDYVTAVYAEISEEKKEKFLADIDKLLELLKNKNNGTAQIYFEQSFINSNDAALRSSSDILEN